MKKRILLLILITFSFSGFGATTPPPAKAVFQVSANQIDPNTFTLHWQIKTGFFLYKERIKLTPNADSNFHLGDIRFPEPILHKDAQGKKYLVYQHDLVVPVSILGEEPGEAFINLHYQGCSKSGFCYPPETKTIKLTINNHLALVDASIEAESITANAPLAENSDKLAVLFSSHNWPLIIVSFFGFGLLLAFTPCILPMVPVLSGIIIGHGKNLSTRKAFLLSLCYVISMSITYAAVGAIVATMGSNLQIIMQSPLAISLFSAVFILLALSMFNVYELKLPVSWQAKLASVTRSHEGGHYLNAALMGSLSILILSPCVTAPLIGALSYIAQSGNVLLGSLSLFFLSLGMGTPLLLIGASAGKLLPKTGAWMNGVKTFFGILLLAVAIFLLSRLLPTVFIMMLWAALFIFSGIYAGALSRSNAHLEKLLQGLGILLLVQGILILIGASQGHDNPLQPLNAETNQSAIATPHAITVVKTLSDAQKAIAQANGKPILIDFYAQWCASCKVMEKTILNNANISRALQQFVLIKADLTQNNAETKALLNHFKVVAPPTFLFFDSQGKEVNQLRIVGDVSAESFYETMTHILNVTEPIPR